jgi:hypothetical protein
MPYRNCRISNHKIIFGIDYDVHYQLALSQIKIQLVYGEKKQIEPNCVV